MIAAIGTAKNAATALAVVAGLEDVLDGQLGEVEVLVGRLMALPLGLAAVARRSAG
jgi:hypothetical protein